MTGPILVLGRSGQLATALAEIAPERVECAGRETVDMANPSAVEAFVRQRAPACVINAAAYTAVDKAEAEPDLAMTINADSPGALARACAALKAPLVHISSDYVFAGDTSEPYTETDPPAPVGAYGRSKAAGEAAVLAAGGDVAIVRTSWVYGPSGANFVRTMLRLAESRDEVGVVADQFGAPTHVDDLAGACLLLADRLLDGGGPEARGVFHYANQGEATWADVAEAVFAAAAEEGLRSARVRRITTAEYPTAARRPANSRLRCDRIAALGVTLQAWRPRVFACVRTIARRAA